MILPAVGSIKRSNVLPKVVFPQPDSPTRPSVSPLKTSKLTSSTAFTNCSDLPSIFFFAGNQTERLLTCNSDVGISDFGYRISDFLFAGRGSSFVFKKSLTTGNLSPLG